MRARIIFGLMLAGLSTAGAEPLPQLPNAAWEVVDEIDSPVSEGVVVPLSGGRALLVGVHGRELARTELYDPATGFTRRADAPAPLDLAFGAALKDGRVLVGGGGQFIDRNKLSDRCFIYDPATDEWTEAARLPRPSFYMYGNTARTLHDGRVMVTGGSTANEAHTDTSIPGFTFDGYISSRNVFFFDPKGKKGSWREGPPMPATRVFATHVPAFEGGGAIPVSSPQLAGRTAHQMVVLPDDRVLLIGGREYNPGNFQGVPWIDAYDPETNSWSRVAQMPSIRVDVDGGYGGRGFPSAVLLESGKVLIFGGTAEQLLDVVDDGGLVTAFNVVGTSLPRVSSLLFDPETHTFENVGRLNVRRSGALAVPWHDGGGAFAIGGAVKSQEPTPQGEVFDPQSRTWSLLPLEPEPTHFDFTSRPGVGLDDGTILTWAALPFWDEPSWPGPGGMRTVKRLHPEGLPVD